MKFSFIEFVFLESAHISRIMKILSNTFGKQISFFVCLCYTWKRNCIYLGNDWLLRPTIKIPVAAAVLWVFSQCHRWINLVWAAFLNNQDLIVILPNKGPHLLFVMPENLKFHQGSSTKLTIVIILIYFLLNSLSQLWEELERIEEHEGDIQLARTQNSVASEHTILELISYARGN